VKSLRLCRVCLDYRSLLWERFRIQREVTRLYGD